MNKIISIVVLLAIVVSAYATWTFIYTPHYVEEGFNIILTKDNSKIISDVDIQSYNATSHDLTLTEECADRMKSLKEPLMGDFVIIIDGKEDLHGVFVPPIVSRSYPSTEVVILYPSIESDYMIMKIQIGYPWDQPASVDPRQSSKIIQYFEKIGKLTR